MKLSSQEEYGLRCLLQIARRGKGVGLTIPEISDAVGISSHYTAKLMRILRRAGFVKSARGQVGGYTLSRPAGQVAVGEVMAALGGRLFDPAFCNDHAGIEQVCRGSIDCSIRSLWRAVQQVVDQVLSRTTLDQLLADEQQMTTRVSHLVKVTGLTETPAEAPAAALMQARGTYHPE
jgi:Rrf2 family protein